MSSTFPSGSVGTGSWLAHPISRMVNKMTSKICVSVFRFCIETPFDQFLTQGHQGAKKVNKKSSKSNKNQK
jgi:hypothetical protein